MIISYIGFESQTVPVTGKASFNITLKPDAQSLKDVVVIGYQEVKRKTTTAAVASVKGKEIENLPSPSFDQLLQGKVAGLNVQNFSGEPGVRGTFVIRGNTSISRNVDNARALSSPLFVIDNIPVSLDDAASFDNTGTNYIAGINPNDIESIDVLKDASAAAIYGSRGANGVVIIKTKRGKPGKPQVNFSTYTGVSQKPKLEPFIIGAEERRYKLDYLLPRASYDQRRDLPMLLTDSLNPSFNNATDWQGLFYRTGTIHNYDVSISGANDVFNYRVSGNYYDEEGIIKNTGFKRYTISAAIGAKMSEKLSMDVLFRLSRGDRSRGRGAAPWEPVLPLSQGQFPSSVLKLTETDSLNYIGAFSMGRDKNINDDITGSLTLYYNIIPDLLFTSTGSIQTSVNARDLFRPGAIQADGLAYAQSSRSRYENLNLDNTLSYTRNLFNKDHHLNVLLGNTINYVNNNFTGIGGISNANDNLKVVQGIDPNNFVFYDPYGALITGSDSKSAGMLSFFARVNYDYKEKYLFSFAWRADASSRFGRDSRWGYFPSVSGGWNVIDEPFAEPLKKWVNTFKIRGSYGITGTLPGGYYLPFNTYSINQGGYGGSNGISYNGVNAVTPNFNGGVSQEGLTWEQSVQSNLGIDASFFDNRITVVADAYNRGKSRILFDLILPATSGYKKVNTNSVSVRNTGFEFNILGRIMSPKNPFQWNSRLIMSFNKNQIVELPNGNRDLVVVDPNNDDIQFILTRGRPIYEFYLMKNKGVYGSDKDVPFNPLTGDKLTYWGGSHPVHAGDYIWEDQNHDYDVWDWNDRIQAGNPNPKVTGGFTNTFSYKGISLEVFVTFLLGRDIFNKYTSNKLYGYQTNFFNIAQMDLNELSIWQKPGDEARYSQLNPYGQNYYQFLPFSSAYIEDGSYARIKYINLSYTFPPRFLERLKLRNLQVYSVIDNLYTFQRSTVPDAEAVNELGIYTGDGYPIPHKYTLGVNIGF